MYIFFVRELSHGGFGGGGVGTVEKKITLQHKIVKE